MYLPEGAARARASPRVAATVACDLQAAHDDILGGRVIALAIVLLLRWAIGGRRRRRASRPTE